MNYKFKSKILSVYLLIIKKNFFVNQSDLFNFQNETQLRYDIFVKKIKLIFFFFLQRILFYFEKKENIYLFICCNYLFFVITFVSWKILHNFVLKYFFKHYYFHFSHNKNLINNFQFFSPKKNTKLKSNFNKIVLALV